MGKRSGSHSVSRRRFLATTGSLLAAAPAVVRGAPLVETSTARPIVPTPANPARKIPLGVFDPVFNKLSLDEMLDKLTGLGLEAVEVWAGSFPNSPHCPVADLLEDAAKARAWKKRFEDHHILIGALSCHGNPVHPNPTLAQRDDEALHRTVLLAERLEVPVIVGFSGCPGDSPTAAHPNWGTYRWPPDFEDVLNWQWEKVVIPYWKQAAKFARAHGVRRIALEMHPNFVVYNPQTLLKLRDAVGEEIGANCDLSHLFWQGCDPVEVIHFLGRQGAIYHAHMKDTVILKDQAARTGVLNFSADPPKVAQGSVIFRAVGYGHGAQLWKDVVQAYMDIGFEGMMSIEHDDPILPGEVGVERSVYVLKNVRAELLQGQ